MARIDGRWIVAGLVAALASAGEARAQGLPDPLPPLPAGGAPPEVAAPGPTVLPTPTVTPVPPAGPLPSWAPVPPDPVALERRRPALPWLKARSWHWRRAQGKALGYPEDFRPRPLGAALHDHGRVMVSNGAAARLVLHRYDFVEGTDRLSPRGLDELSKLAPQLCVSPYPLLIERTPEAPGLAEARRLAVLETLAGGPNAIDPGRVIVGAPIARGMSGIDAQIVGANALDRLKDYGPPIPIQYNGVNSPSGVTSGR